MLIEDFKKIVETYQVGDEVRLEMLCREWNREIDEAEQEIMEDEYHAQIDELEETIRVQHDRIEKLEVLSECDTGEIKELTGSLAATEEELKRVEQTNTILRCDLADSNKMVSELTKQAEVLELVLAGYRNELLKQTEMIKVLRQALEEG